MERFYRRSDRELIGTRLGGNDLIVYRATWKRVTLEGTEIAVVLRRGLHTVNRAPSGSARAVNPDDSLPVFSSEQAPCMAIEGWFEPEDRQIFEVVRLEGNEDDIPKRPPTDEAPGERPTTRVSSLIRCILREAPEETSGAMMHWTAELRRYENIGASGDYLLLELPVPIGFLEPFVSRMERDPTIKLRIQASVALFENEVEARFGELNDLKFYLLPYDGRATACLEALQLGETARFPDLLKEEKPTEHIEEAPALQVPARQVEYTSGPGFGTIRKLLWAVLAMTVVIAVASLAK